MWRKLKARLFSNYRIVKWGNGEYSLQKRTRLTWNRVGPRHIGLDAAMLALNKACAEDRIEAQSVKKVQVFYA